MRVLALLVAVLLPLHGVANGVASILSPAHYHLAMPVAAVVANAAEAPHLDAPVEPADHHDPATDGSGHHAPGKHDDHHDHDAPVEPDDHDDHVLPAEPDTHQDHTIQGGHDAVIGHHSHGFEQADVVYLESDADRADLGAGGKHASANAEAALPIWSMPTLATIDMQVLPQAGCHFCSCRDKPLLRPPAAIGSALT